MTFEIAKFGRRQFLSDVVTTAVAGTFAVSLPPAASTTMRTLAASKGLLFGTAMRDSSIQDSQFALLVAEQCSILVPEWALKWDTLRPRLDRFDFRPADALLKFAEANKLYYRGHTLIWHEALPGWFATTVNSSNARAILLDHISTVVRHYAGKMSSWDVVNEIIDPSDGNPDGLRESPWLRFIGPEYVETAFHAAHEADPKAVLVYNENQLESDNAHTDAKRQRVLALIKNLLRKGVPIHALGIQSHIPPEGFVGCQNFRRFLQEVSDQGLAIFVTEMDVSDQLLVGDLTQRDNLVASRYYEYLSFILQFPSVKGVVTWGLSNRYTWLARNEPRKDGLPVRPLPFDADLKPTEAWDAIQRAIAKAPKR
jgi:endo-1,4-beta-xylanase